jgi:sulfotransferase
MIQNQIHFISGLPRSGSTLLSAILRQNPAFHAAMSGPLCGMFVALQKSMGPRNEYSMFVDDEQRSRVLSGMVASYYQHLSQKSLIFDTNRAWTAHMSALALLFPSARVICCLRSPAWILDSVERRVQSAPFPVEKMFPGDSGENVYTRCEHLLKKGFLAAPLQNLRQAWFGENAHRLIAIRYNSLTEDAAGVIGRLYELLNQPPYPHDFENVEYEASEFDEKLGMPGLHTVRRRVEVNRRITILPSDLFQPHDRSFWDVPGQNPRGVTIL